MKATKEIESSTANNRARTDETAVPKLSKLSYE